MKSRHFPADLVVIIAGITAAMHVGKLPPALPVLRNALGGLARDASQLMVLRAIGGFGLLLAILSVPSLLRDLVAPERLNLRLGLWGTFMPVGTAIALLCGPWVMAVVGWPGWWWTLSALTAAMAVWTAVGVPPDHTRRQSANEGAGVVGAETSWVRRLRLTLSSAGPWLVALSFAAYSTASGWPSSASCPRSTRRRGGRWRRQAR